eukprot:gnl/MRDRNA2_/MRDRNA2_99686_c0_seq1.p1 gnl/MRDRNA2_/MRDRNA2_99686_c0~~gnl/MRDRNA2_/MRDRNA2_99686_c0_seq1.p1  ORF type:complete len:834 (+),score=224.73 gnl/MRDRNA2_/MRDRNA2_99686_c0_seq1:63-2564(+)
MRFFSIVAALVLGAQAFVGYAARIEKRQSEALALYEGDSPAAGSHGELGHDASLIEKPKKKGKKGKKAAKGKKPMKEGKKSKVAADSADLASTVESIKKQDALEAKIKSELNSKAEETEASDEPAEDAKAPASESKLTAERKFPSPRFADATSQKAQNKWLKSHNKAVKKAKKEASKKTKAKKLSASSRKVSGDAPQRFHEIDFLPVRKFGDRRCGDKIPASSIGIKKEVAAFWAKRGIMLLQEEPAEEPEPSMAKPGAGANQVLADHPLEKSGSVNNVESMLKVFKDGFYPVRCLTDAMEMTSDKFGNNMFDYADTSNVSIVRYSEIIAKPFQKPMTPEVCYQFCQTVPDMVFFGIAYGDDCYCTPYFKPSPAGGSAACDSPCPGDPTQMCGGQGKSSIFEMHLCADTAEEVVDASTAADEVLVYFYDSAFLADAIAAELQLSGETLMKVAGASGDSAASDMGMSAKVAAGDVSHSIVSFGCLDNYNELMTAYKDAKDVRTLDFTFAKNIQEADAAVATMKTLAPEVEGCAKAAERQSVMSYPFYKEVAAMETADAFQAKIDAYADGLQTYLPTSYVQDSSLPAGMSTCSGKVLLKPAVVTLGECAEACDRMRYPASCTGFQFFNLGKTDDGDTVSPLCFLFEAMYSVTTYECDFLTNLQKDLPPLLSLAQKNKPKSFLQKHNFNSTANATDSSDAETEVKVDWAALSRFDKTCLRVRMVMHSSGLSCAELFGADSSIKDKCKKECEVTQSAKYSAICMSKMASMPAQVEMKKFSSCFGGDDNAAEDSTGAPVKSAVDLGDTGLVIEGAVELEGGETVEEPFPELWTREAAK